MDSDEAEKPKFKFIPSLQKHLADMLIFSASKLPERKLVHRNDFAAYLKSRIESFDLKKQIEPRFTYRKTNGKWVMKIELDLDLKERLTVNFDVITEPRHRLPIENYVLSLFKFDYVLVTTQSLTFPCLESLFEHFQNKLEK